MILSARGTLIEVSSVPPSLDCFRELVDLDLELARASSSENGINGEGLTHLNFSNRVVGFCRRGSGATLCDLRRKFGGGAMRISGLGTTT